MGIPSKCEEVVLRVPMYCKGCETRVRECALKFEGVKYAEAKLETNILTVKGEVDPSKIQVFISENTKKTVELISSRPMAAKSKEIVVVKNGKGEKVGKQPLAGSRSGAKVAGTNNIFIQNMNIEKLYLSRPPPPNGR